VEPEPEPVPDPTAPPLDEDELAVDLLAPIAKAFEQLTAARDGIEPTALGLGMMVTREMNAVSPSTVVCDAWVVVMLEQ
jgi:hypothetical protein